MFEIKYWFVLFFALIVWVMIPLPEWISEPVGVILVLALMAYSILFVLKWIYLYFYLLTHIDELNNG